MEIGAQVLSGENVDWMRIGGVSALSVASTSAGSLVGTRTTELFMTKWGSTSEQMAKVLGGNSPARLSPTRFATGVGTATSGGIASLLFAYGGVALGLWDIQTGNSMAITGGITTGVGVGLGWAASSATFSVAAAYGTAGTGAAISTLSGAAATNATLASLGGGTVASGAGGVAAGKALLASIWTGGAVAGVVLVGGVMYGIYKYNEWQDDKCTGMILAYLSEQETFSTSP